MPDAFEILQISDQKFPAPHRRVDSIAETVERNSDRRPLFSIVGQAGRDLRVMMLHANQFDAIKLQRLLGREIFGMKIVGDDRRIDRKQPPVMLDTLGERAQRFVIFKIADARGWRRDQAAVADGGCVPRRDFR